MKTSAIVCAVLAGSLGFSTLASAQEWRGHEREGGQQRFEQRHEEHAMPERAWQQHRAYSGPRYYAYNGGPRFHRGGFVPREYLNRGYYVNWQTYPGLYAPPYGYRWVNVGGEILLVALATGLIANAIAY